MIDREVDIMLDELRTSLAQSGLTLEDYLRGAKKEEAAMRAELSKSAEIRVKGKVVLKAVAEAEQLAVTPEEMQAEVKAMAESMGEEVPVVEQRLAAAGRQYINDYLLRKKRSICWSRKQVLRRKKHEYQVAIDPDGGGAVDPGRAVI